MINPKTVIIFSDGACEDDGEVVSRGAVLYDSSNGIRKYFGEMAPNKIDSSWRKGGKKQLVGQAEMLPVLVSKIHWKNLLQRRRVLWFMDTGSARAAYGSRASHVDDSFNMLCVSGKVDNMLHAYHWCTRVPSCANVSDPASHLDFSFYDESYDREWIDWSSDEMTNLMKACCV